MFMSAKNVDAEKKGTKNPLKFTIDYFGSVKREFKTLSWTSAKELRKVTKVVIISTLSAGFLVYFADLGIQKVLNALGLLARLIFG